MPTITIIICGYEIPAVQLPSIKSNKLFDYY